MRRATIVMPLVILSLSGCAWIGQNRVVDSQRHGISIGNPSMRCWRNSPRALKLLT